MKRPGSREYEASELAAAAGGRTSAPADGATDIFRPEAIKHHATGPGDRGHPLRIAPGWSRWVFHLVVLVFVAAALFASLGSIHEYATGPAVIRWHSVELATERQVAADDELAQPGKVTTAGGGGREPGIVALLPGRFRPLLEPGMQLRFELQGYRDAHQYLTIDRIGNEVIGPAEARILVGSSLTDAVPVHGPVIWLRAPLPSSSFESHGQLYRYYDGMVGTAEIQVRSEPILSTLLPGLRGVL